MEVCDKLENIRHYLRQMRTADIIMVYDEAVDELVKRGYLEWSR